MSKSKLRQVADSAGKSTTAGVVTLLLKDHRAMRSLMKEIKSPRATPAKIVSRFRQLEKIVTSHVAAEEESLLKKIADHPRFEEEALEGIEEHAIHRTILAGIHRVTGMDRRTTRMKIFCEILEHHLDEEEEDLFPRFKKYAALSTRKKIGKQFLATRRRTHKPGEKLGALEK